MNGGRATARVPTPRSRRLPCCASSGCSSPWSWRRRWRPSAQKPIKVGYPMILSGPGALFGEPSLKGAQMFVEEINAKGGVLGRKIELISRDTKGNADEAVRVARELILKDNVDFLVGTLTSAEGPGGLADRQGEQDRLHRADPEDRPAHRAGTTCIPTCSARPPTPRSRAARAAEIMAKWPVKRVATISPDYAYGQDVDQGVRRAPQEDQARRRDRRPAVAEARRGRLHAVHQRADGARSRRPCSRGCGAAIS